MMPDHTAFVNPKSYENMLEAIPVFVDIDPEGYWLVPDFKKFFCFLDNDCPVGRVWFILDGKVWRADV